MGGANSGNRKAKGQKGNTGGTGRPPKPNDEKKTKIVRMSPRLWDKIQLATVVACENDWHQFLEKLLEDGA